MKVKNILFFVLFSSLYGNLIGQDDRNQQKDTTQKIPFIKRLKFNVGGGFGFGSTNGFAYSNINIQPQVGYKITENLIAGVGANYQYLKYGTANYQIYGGNAFVRYFVSSQFFLQTEYQVLNYSYQTTRAWNDYLLAGGGYMPGSGFYISAYYLLKFPPNNNIYGQPYVIRAGIMF